MLEENQSKDAAETKCLIIVYSYHHNNTAKIAKVISETLHAQIMTPDQVKPEELQAYDLIGFGAGIDSGKHYKPLLDLADRLPEAKEKPCFIFSTSAIQGERKVAKDHAALRTTLLSNGYLVKGEFSCKGFNTNAFLKYFGGMNKGKPDQQDLKHAEEFALRMKEFCK